MRCLVTGGAGYIGSHTVLALQEAGHDVHVIDNLSNSSAESLNRVARLSGARPGFTHADILDFDPLCRLMQDYAPDAVLHLAGAKSVGESVEDPLKYYEQNVAGTVSLLRAMQRFCVRRLVFSSSATVYGATETMPVTEEATLGPVNPYGATKLVVEQMLGEMAKSNPAWAIARLRYFNPVGAHPSGEIGEDPSGRPNNLLPFVSQVAVGRRKQVEVFGDDYSTPDGTGVRDYIHVMDLAEGHVAALNYLSTNSGSFVWNIGTGIGTSVLEIIEAFGRISGRPIPYRISGRRPGDVAESFADPSRAEKDLGWVAKRGLDDFIADAWAWQSRNPTGFGPTP